MGATNSFESEVLRHILLNEPITDIGDAAGLLPSAAEGNVYICLLTQPPGEDGSIVNEAAYGGYARVAVPRGAAGWIEANGTIQNVAAITFPECLSGSEDLIYFGICKTLAGDDIIFYEALNAPFSVSQEMQPEFDIGQLAISVD